MAVRRISFIRLTGEGRDKLPASAYYLMRITEIAHAAGGRILELWATDGHYDFVALSEFPDDAAAFKARTHMLELGVFEIESAGCFEMSTLLASV